MELKTKFNINDDVWFLHPHSQKAVCGKIMKIKVEVGSKPKYKPSPDGKRGLVNTGEYETRIFYPLYYIDDMVRKDAVSKSEYEIFENKEQLVKSLKAKAESL